MAAGYHAPVTAVTRRWRVRTALVSGALALLVSVVVAVAGCGHSGKPGATSTTTTPHATWSRPSAPPDPRTLESAGATAVAAVPNGTLTSIHIQEAGSWRVVVVTPDGTEQTIDVSSDGNTLLVGPSPKNESDADKAKERALVQAAHLDYRAAVDKFLAAVANGSITEMRLEDSNGSTVWEAEVWDTYIVEHKVTINAASGELIANRQV